MKLGYELEGKHCGSLTLFCNVQELLVTSQQKLVDLVNTYHVERIYVSDLTNMITNEDLRQESQMYTKLMTFSGVTIERTSTKDFIVPYFVTLMLNIKVNNDVITELERLRCCRDAEFKFDSGSKFVAVGNVEQLVTTNYSQYVHDKVLS